MLEPELERAVLSRLLTAELGVTSEGDVLDREAGEVDDKLAGV